MDQFTINLNVFLDEILKEIHQEGNAYLKNLMLEKLDREILKAIALNGNPFLLSTLNARYPGETNPDFILSQCIAQCPQIQIGILDAMEKFREEMIESAPLEMVAV